MILRQEVIKIILQLKSLNPGAFETIKEEFFPIFRWILLVPNADIFDKTWKAVRTVFHDDQIVQMMLVLDRLAETYFDIDKIATNIQAVELFADVFGKLANTWSYEDSEASFGHHSPRKLIFLDGKNSEGSVEDIFFVGKTSIIP